MLLVLLVNNIKLFLEVLREIDALYRDEWHEKLDLLVMFNIEKVFTFSVSYTL